MRISRTINAGNHDVAIDFTNLFIDNTKFWTFQVPVGDPFAGGSHSAVEGLTKSSTRFMTTTFASVTLKSERL